MSLLTVNGQTIHGKVLNGSLQGHIFSTRVIFLHAISQRRHRIFSTRQYKNDDIDLLFKDTNGSRRRFTTQQLISRTLTGLHSNSTASLLGVLNGFATGHRLTIQARRIGRINRKVISTVRNFMGRSNTTFEARNARMLRTFKVLTQRRSFVTRTINKRS